MDLTSPFIGELVGTMVLILLGDGVVAAVLLEKSKAKDSGWIVITTGWCFAVMMGVFAAIFFGSNYAHINPAVTIAMILYAELDIAIAVELILGQFAGAFIGATLVWLAYLQHFGETEDKGLKLAVFCTAPAIRNPITNLITEIIGTFVLVLSVITIFFMSDTPLQAGAALSDHAIGTIAIAFVVWGIGLSLGGPTGYAINPARDLGPRIAHFLLPVSGKGDSDWTYSWIPVVGPIIGGLAAALLGLILVLE